MIIIVSVSLFWTKITYLLGRGYLLLGRTQLPLPTMSGLMQELNLKLGFIFGNDLNIPVCQSSQLWVSDCQCDYFFHCFLQVCEESEVTYYSPGLLEWVSLLC